MKIKLTESIEQMPAGTELEAELLELNYARIKLGNSWLYLVPDQYEIIPEEE